MEVICTDLEGVLVPEIWEAVAAITGIEALKRTTRDEPDYDRLMRFRLEELKKHDLKLPAILDVIEGIAPFPEAKEFLDRLRAVTQVIVVSDTFTQFGMPLMKKLGYPTLFCNTLTVAEDGEITGYRMRCERSKLTTVRSLQSMGFETIAFGDSHNDLEMIRASKKGFLFCPPDAIRLANPDISAFETYDALYDAITEALA